MNKAINNENRFLNSLKKILVRFRNAGFGIKFIKNITKIKDYFKDSQVSILGKGKVAFSIIASLIYFVFAIDIIPELFLGPIGFLDDVFVIIWAIGIINEELEKYNNIQNYSNTSNKKEYRNSTIIDDVSYVIKDEN